MYAVFHTHSAHAPACEHYVCCFPHTFGHTPACEHNVCCFPHTFGPCACVRALCMLFSTYIQPYACVRAQCMLFSTYISAIRLRASTMYAVFHIHSAHAPACEHDVCCFPHTFGPHTPAPAHCMLFSTYIRPMRLPASTMYAVFHIHLGHTPACEHNVCCFSHTFGPCACVRVQCMLFFTYIRPYACVRALCMLFSTYIQQQRHSTSYSKTGAAPKRRRNRHHLQYIPLHNYLPL
ncbi:hypothetical protein J2Z70_000160 [Paenibacillus silagei]|uniref:Uncharacterized protein n=1 Tax=Paenibacillus silagei TaxID=1670801 RepID=A0ABS4NJ09_9BACL|nr:hypothetical protein [Paenibacillus silagei]